MINLFDFNEKMIVYQKTLW